MLLGMARTVRVGVLLMLDIGQDRGVLRGTTAFARERGWEVILARPDRRQLREVLASRPAGLIARIPSDDLATALRVTRLPVVSVSHTQQTDTFPRVGFDHHAAGQMAANAMLARGYRHFAFVGIPNVPFSAEREAGFAAAIRKAGKDYVAAPVPRRRHLGDWNWRNPSAAQRQWLLHLPRPCALVVATDGWALPLVNACRVLGLSVPDDVAVLSIDNDDLRCESAAVPISSVDLPHQELGYRAAKALQQLLRSPRSIPRVHALQPVGIVHRRSTEAIVAADPAVAEAVRFIRARAADPIGVEDVVSAVATSRRYLEKQFRAQLDLSPAGLIRQTRVDLARALLRASDLPIPQIARRSGFASRERLSVVFKQVTGMTPVQFRQMMRRVESPDT
jgi:LacI family transcriptional regulator